MLFNIPLSANKATQLINLISLSEESHVLDVGCGEGAFLMQLLESTNAQGLGLDINQEAILTARKNARQRIPASTYEFRVADIQNELFEDDFFDLALCLGSTHAFGSGDTAFPNSLQALRSLVCPGGLILIGEGYWKQNPSPAYLQFLGDPVGIYRDHAANIAFAEQYDLIPMYAAVSNEDEWDHFEWSHRMAHEREAFSHPDDPVITAKVRQSRTWRDGYLQWGRTTMGFGFYLFMKPAETSAR